VALLLPTASAAGLEVLYLLAVLAIASRRGERPALVMAVLSVLTVNYLFIPPRHELLVARSQDVVDLIVLMVAAPVVGRLAAVARQRAAEAESRAILASATCEMSSPAPHPDQREAHGERGGDGHLPARPPAVLGGHRGSTG
jgi:two-component system sensor histidine kinase KdpD